MKKLLGIFCICLLLIGCGRNGSYTIAYTTDVPPYIYDYDGEQKGFLYDLAESIEKVENVSISFKRLDKDDIKGRLESKKLDAIVSDVEGLALKETEIYANVDIMVVAVNNNKAALKLSDIAGKTVGVYATSKAVNFLKENRDRYGYAIKYFDDIKSIEESSKNEDIDYIVDDSRFIKHLIDKKIILKKGYLKQLSESYRLKVPEKNDKFLEVFNRGIVKLINNGEYAKIADNYKLR